MIGKHGDDAQAGAKRLRLLFPGSDERVGLLGDGYAGGNVSYRLKLVTA